MSTSSLDRLAKGTIKKLLERRGYWVRHRSVLPFGLDYMNDIRRLSGIYGWSVDTFFDVGANVGQTSKEALHNFPAASVYAFEPHHTTFAKLVEDIRDPRFHPHNLALSDKSGTASFFDYGPLATSNSLVANAQYAMQASHPATVRSVECETIDAFCTRIGVDLIDVLKIDTEGHEMAVLAGASEMLESRRVKVVYVEFNTMLPKEGTSGGALSPIGALLEPMGFRFVASYAEYMITTDDLFVTSNALFVNSRR